MFVSLKAFPGPPVDLTDFREGDTPVGAQKRRSSDIREEDLIYTKPGSPGPAREGDGAKKEAPLQTAYIKSAVAGRAAPNRDGKILQQLKRGDIVQLLKPSSDGFWMAVETVATRRKLWVPKNVLHINRPKKK